MKYLYALPLAAFAALLASTASAGTIVAQPYADEWGYTNGGSGLVTVNKSVGASGLIVWAQHQATAAAQKNWLPRVPTTLLASLNNTHIVDFHWRCEWIPDFPGDTPSLIHPYMIWGDIRKNYTVGTAAQMTGSGFATASTIEDIYLYGMNGNTSVTAAPGTGPQFSGESTPDIEQLAAGFSGVVFALQPDGRWIGTGSMYYGGLSHITGSAEISDSPNPSPTSAMTSVNETHYTEAEVTDVTGVNVTNWYAGTVAP